MRLYEFFSPIKESLYYKGPIHLRYGSEVDIVILKNPVASEFRRFKDRTKWKNARGLLSDDLLVWDAALAIHSDISRNFKVDGDDLHMKENGVEINDLHPEFTDEEAVEYAAYLKSNRHLVAIYGPDFEVLLEAPDVDKHWTF